MDVFCMGRLSFSPYLTLSEVLGLNGHKWHFLTTPLMWKNNVNYLCFVDLNMSMVVKI